MSSSLLRTGQTVAGLWHKRCYLVESQVGSGAVGEVYRVQGPDGKTYALKISLQSSEIALEHRTLQRIQGVARGVNLGPLVYDVDDVATPHGKAFFYVMEWVRGRDLPSFLQLRGRHWTPVLLLQLCNCLELLHAEGRCFGDLKVENCLVDESEGRLRLVDFGGVTPFGRGVKEYTEWYDRAWWGQGTRAADPGYDLFALTMLTVQLIAPELRAQATAAGTPNFAKVAKHVLQEPAYAHWRPLLQGVWSGRITETSHFRQMLTPLLRKSVEAEKRRRRPASSRRRDWTDWLLFGSAALLVLVFCQFFILG